MLSPKISLYLSEMYSSLHINKLTVKHFFSISAEIQVPTTKIASFF